MFATEVIPEDQSNLGNPEPLPAPPLLHPTRDGHRNGDETGPPQEVHHGGNGTALPPLTANPDGLLKRS